MCHLRGGVKLCGVVFTEWWQVDRFPEFLHAALHHHEPPCAPQSKSSIFLLQRAHHHPSARPDVWRPYSGQIGKFTSLHSLYYMFIFCKLISLISFHLFIQKGFDVFNALDLMENKTFLEKLKFGIGDGNLQYYLYNWKCPSMGSEKVIFFCLLLYLKHTKLREIHLYALLV